MWNIRQLLSDQAQACPAKQQQHSNRNITIRISHTLATAEQAYAFNLVPRVFAVVRRKVRPGGKTARRCKRRFSPCFARQKDRRQCPGSATDKEENTNRASAVGIWFRTMHRLKKASRRLRAGAAGQGRDTRPVNKMAIRPFQLSGQHTLSPYKSTLFHNTESLRLTFWSVAPS